ncbi:MAG: FMN-binding protein [Cephaloticoccus sp.]|nr:FMN-binding protein [Cephaloticoccus sp.]MCF7759913.1 FMN-binding protein [Cephaloticoccus sp.]
MSSPHRLLYLTLPLAVIGSTSGYAVTYLTPTEAQEALWPGIKLEAVKISLTREQRRSIQTTAGTPVSAPAFTAWRTAEGGWFLIDQVLGKHEFITYAVALTPAGAVAGLEILDYRETYGGEVRNEKWRAQFDGKTSSAPLKLDQDIKNITGATLSCRHVTDGVKRLLATYDHVLKHH